MKVVKILGVVFGGLFLLTGLALLAGSAIFGASQGEFDRQLAEQGLAGPAEGRVTAINGPVFTVDYTDRNGTSQTGRGPVAEGTTPPELGDDVQVYYFTLDPSQIIILDFPGGNFAGVAGLLRTVAIVCLVVGAVLLIAGIISMVTGRRRQAAVTAGSAGPPGPPAPDQPDQPAQPDQPTRPDQTTAAAASAGPDADPTPSPPRPPDPEVPEPEQNRPGG